MDIPPSHTIEKKYNTTHGFSLIEAAIVLGVVGLVIGGIWVAASSVSENRKIAQMASDILLICDRAGTTFPASLAPASDTSLSNTQLINSGVFPASWVQGSNAVPPLGRHLGSFWMSIANNGEYRLNITDLTQAQCLNLLPKLALTTSSMIRHIAVGTGWWTTYTQYSSFPHTAGFNNSCDDGTSIHIEISCATRR